MPNEKCLTNVTLFKLISFDMREVVEGELPTVEEILAELGSMDVESEEARGKLADKIRLLGVAMGKRAIMRDIKSERRREKLEMLIRDRYSEKIVFYNKKGAKEYLLEKLPSKIGGFTADEEGLSMKPSTTDTDLWYLRNLIYLRKLYLMDIQRITDAGLIHLAGLINLQELDLGHTQIGDAGLAHLAGLVNLRELFLRGTQVTDAGVARLKEAIPGLEVAR